METLQTIIDKGDPREIKRAMTVKMLQSKIEVKLITEVLSISDKFVSKWKLIYEKEGADALLLNYKGSESYLNEKEIDEIIKYLKNHKSIKFEDFVEYIEKQYGIVYKSKQSYYDLLKKSRMSWHKTQKANPKRDEQKIAEKREEIKKKLNDRSQEIKDGKLVVLLEDESHLIWGDACGLIWGKTNEKVEIPMTNFRERQTYFGAVNLMSKVFHIEPYPSGNGVNTVDFVKKLQAIYQGAKLLFIWDGASYHKYSEMRAYLGEINKGLEEKDWLVTCILFAPNAPEQNPVEDIWLKGKNWIRKHFFENKTFAQVKQCFFEFLKNRIFDFHKFEWYMESNLQII